MISRRTKEALAAAKSRSVVLGVKNPRVGAKAGNEALATAARQFATRVLPIIRDIEAADIHTQPGSLRH
jgi:hypothetical protein